MGMTELRRQQQQKQLMEKRRTVWPLTYARETGTDIQKTKVHLPVACDVIVSALIHAWLPLASPMLSCRVIVTDARGTAWVGSESGNVRRICLVPSQDADSPHRFTLDVAHTFKRYSTSSRSASQQLCSSEDMPADDFSRADSAHHAEDLTGSEEGSAAGLTGVKAHAGPVSAIEVHKGRVFTSGGTQKSATLIEWDIAGTMLHSHDLKELGEFSVISEHRIQVKLTLSHHKMTHSKQ